MKPVAVINYSEFHKVPAPDDSFYLLRQYPTDLIIITLSKINHYLFHEVNRSAECQKLIMQNCFQNLHLAKFKRILQGLAHPVDAGELTFFTGPAILKLINLSLLNFHPIPIEDEPVNIAQFKNDLFDSVLICNEQFYSNISNNSDMTSYESIWKLQMMQEKNIRDHVELIFIAPVRSFLFHKYMISQFPNGRKYLSEFSKNLELKGYFEYHMIFQDIIHKVIEAYKEDKNPKNIVDLSNAQMMVIQNFAIKHKDLQNSRYEGKTHAELIPRPFYMLMDKHPVILDLHFFNYIVDLALTYNIYNHSSLRNSQEFKSFDDFKGCLGRSFYEQFIMKEILKNLYREKNFSLFDSKHDSSFPDFAVVRNQRDILLIEVKSAALHLYGDAEPGCRGV